MTTKLYFWFGFTFTESLSLSLFKFVSPVKAILLMFIDLLRLLRAIYSGSHYCFVYMMLYIAF